MKNLGLTDPDGQLAHLRVVAGDAASGAYLEMRFRAAGTAMACEFFAVGDRQALLDAINRRSRKTDVYVGCAPRSRRAGTKDAVAEVWTLWAECDGASAAAAAREFMPRPAMIVASGSGPNIHAYWPLRHPIAPQDAERANLRLASAIGADANCFDASRILRPPGTWNHKSAPPHRVALVEHRLAVRFDIDEVVAGLRHVDVEPVDRRWRQGASRRQVSDPLLRIAPPVYVRRLLGVSSVAGRKVRCPFHDDERPSLHVYRSPERGWHCYSCRRGGSIYDLAAEAWGMGTRGRAFIELRRRLMEEFAVELSSSQSLAGGRSLTR